MPSVTLSAVPKLEFFDAVGNPLVGGKLFTYLAGTSTLAATYTDSTGVTANANPIILDARGEANVWLVQSQAYKFTLQDALGNLIYTVDNVNYAGVSGVSQTFANGTAAAPSVNFVQATNSGLYSPGINQVAISSNGAQVMLFDASQNVGIGGTPTTKLDVFGPARVQGALTVSTGGITATGASSNTGAFTVQSGVFKSNGFEDDFATAAPQWKIDTSGRLLNVTNSQPAFAANRTGSTQTTGTVLLFNSAIFNYGTGYATGTGIFTAPVAGLYSFSVSAEVQNTGSSVSGTFGLVSATQGQLAGMSYSYLTGASQFVVTCTCSAVVLAAGEQISANTSTAFSGTFFMLTTTNSRFCGALLR